ncbi:MAG: cytochrome P450 [Actinomycetes bacterium]
MTAGFLSPDYFKNPYETYSQFHENSPIFWHEEISAWIISPYSEVEKGLSNSNLNAGERIASASAHLTERERKEFSTVIATLSNWIVFQDPPKHTRLRKLVNKSFTPRAIEAFRPKLEAIVLELVSEALTEKEFDFVSHLSFKLPAIVICELLGIPRERQNDVRRWSDKHAGFSASAQVSYEAAKAANDASIEASNYLFSLFDELRRNPGENILSKLVNMDEAEDHLSYEELAALTIQLFFAGFETTEGLIGNLVLALHNNPEQMQILKGDQSKMDGAIEEALRYDSSILKQSRVASIDMEIGGFQIAKGDYCHFMIGAANRDPNRYESPDKFLIERPDLGHSSFGHGIHFCIGAPLARLETKTLMGVLLEKVPSLRVTQKVVEYPQLFAVRKPLELQVSVI